MRNENAIIIRQKVNSSHKYETYPEKTLGQKLKKLRFINGLTAKELGKLCGRCENSIHNYESDAKHPHYSIMKKISKVLGVTVQSFNDDYYNFVLSDGYEILLKDWRKSNTNSIEDVEKLLGVSYTIFRTWEKGDRMSRETFEKIRDLLQQDKR